LLGCGASVDVTAGENKGSTLEHDFVVLNLMQKKLKASESIVRCLFASPGITNQDFQRYALAAWVTSTTSPTPLQCTGCWYDEDIAD